MDRQFLQSAMLPSGKQLSGTFLAIRVSLSATGLPLLVKMPPPWAAVLPVTVLSLTVSGPPGAPNVKSGLTPSSRIPPPSPDAVLLRTWLRVTVSVPLLEGAPARLKLRLAMPPPAPWSPEPSVGAALRFTWLPVMVMVPWLRMPPPGALLPLTALALMVAVPPLAMPPAPSAGPPLEVLPLTWLKLRVRTLPPMPPIPVPLAMPPPPPAAGLPLTWLALRFSVPAWFKMPPALPEVVLPLTWLKLRVVVPTGPVPFVPEAMPPPALIIPPADVLPVTVLWLRVSVPSRLKMPPPGPGVLPPVMVRPCNIRFPVPVTRKMRKVLLFPAIVVWKPFKVILLAITGSPLAPVMGFELLAVVRV